MKFESSKKSKSKISLIAALFLFSVFTNVHLTSEASIVLPGASIFLSALLILIFFPRRTLVFGPIFKFSILFNLICIMSVLFAGGSLFSVDRSFGLAMLLYSSGIAFVFFNFFNSLKISEVRQAIDWLLALVILIAVLERFFGLQESLNFFYETMFPVNRYVDISRDEFTVGFRRPSVLTAEPSFAASGLGAMLVVRGLLESNVRHLLYLVGIGVLMLLVIGSPQVLFGVFGLICHLIFRGGQVTGFQVLFSLILFILVICILAVAGEAIVDRLSVFSPRLADIWYLRDGSFTLRIILPLYVISDAFLYSPFGVGFSGSEILIDKMSIIANNIMPRDYAPGAEHRIHFPIAQLLMFLGGLGSLLAFWSLLSLMRALKVRSPIFLIGVVVLLMMSGLGAFYSPKFTVLIALILIGAMKGFEESRLQIYER